MSNLVDQLGEIVTSPEIAGFAVRARYRPAGNDGEKLMPPSFPLPGDTPYLIEPHYLDGTKHDVVVLDQVPSQANRIEEAVLDAVDDGTIRLPMFELVAKTGRGEVRLTSFDFPHRYADAYLRDSLVEGKRFDESEVGRRLRDASDNDARPIYEREPISLVMGAWDSHRKGRWPKYARLYQSRMYGLDPEIGSRAGSRIDPINLKGVVDDKDKAETDWQYFAEGEKVKGKRLSEIGHGHIAPALTHGGVSVTSIHRIATVSQASLRRIRFGDASSEACDAARSALLALALVGDRLTFERSSLHLRSGCDLVRVEEEIGIERDGGALDPLAFGSAEAVQAFDIWRERAAAAGIVMADDTIRLEPIPSLQAAIEHAMSASDPSTD